MIEPNDTEISTLVITDLAREAVLKAVENLKQDWFLRIFVQNSPAGLQYAMAIDTRVHSQDEVFEIDNMKVVIDNISFPFVKGATVDFVNSGDKSGFKITNPFVDLSAIGGSCCSGGSCGGGSCGGGSFGSGGCC